jgi:DNA-binding MarR family transcriptional regulator
MSRQIRGADRFGADHVGLRREQWARELPDLDTVGMAVLGRARWITLKVRPAIEAIFDRHGLDTGEFDVVATLLRSGPPYRLRPTELYRSLMISSGGLTNRLARLEKAGLVRRAESGSDARSLPVELTGKGRATAEAAIRADMECEAALLAGLSSEEQEALGRLLSKLALSLDRCGGSESA